MRGGTALTVVDDDDDAVVGTQHFQVQGSTVSRHAGRVRGTPAHVHDGVRGQLVLLHHRGTDPRGVFALRRAQAHRDGLGQRAQGSLWILLRGVLHSRRHRRLRQVPQRYGVGRTSHTCGFRLGIRRRTSIRTWKEWRTSARRVPCGLRRRTRRIRTLAAARSATSPKWRGIAGDHDDGGRTRCQTDQDVTHDETDVRRSIPKPTPIKLRFVVDHSVQRIVGTKDCDTTRDGVFERVRGRTMHERRGATSTTAARPRLSSSSSRFSPRGVVQRVHVHAVGRKLHVPHHGSADEAVLHRRLHTRARRCGRQQVWIRPRRLHERSFDEFSRAPCADASARLRRARRRA
mmetsp:Transcript_3263/g.20321  ORF Transcript_3263/g.20321 Transcript_3263/m.20321 type:complete len:346 (+) Transcript_3263:158-1195(+)